MGNGIYCSTAVAARVIDNGYATKSTAEIFKQKSINHAMNPFGVKLRESRDSKEHPNSLAIIIALDVTGSMGSIPHHLVKEGLVSIMESIIKSGIKDPQVLFLGIGDHECDSFPLQVGQFESSDELLDKWLTSIFLEGGGGGNDGESYLLAWYFAGLRTSIDCLEKRGQKGFLFTIGDEPVLCSVSEKAMKGILGEGQYDKNSTSMSLLDEARKKYSVYHIHIKETGAGADKRTVDGWKQLLGNNLKVAERHQDVSMIISEIVCKNIDNKNDGAVENKGTEVIL